jgi:hypothetical protein
VLPTPHDLAFVHAYGRGRSIISAPSFQPPPLHRRFPPRLPPRHPVSFLAKLRSLPGQTNRPRTGATEVNRARHNLRADGSHHGRRPPAPSSLPVLCSVARAKPVCHGTATRPHLNRGWVRARLHARPSQRNESLDRYAARAHTTRVVYSSDVFKACRPPPPSPQRKPSLGNRKEACRAPHPPFPSH